MCKKRITGAALLFVVLSLVVLAACSGGAQAIKPKWVNTRTQDGITSVSLSEVKANGMTHFRVNTQGGSEVFMAYELDGQVQVRASVCPPCRSESFSLKGDRLVCNTCGTVFNAKNGAGIEGACVAFPKASVAYQVKGDSLALNDRDLLKAYQDTLERN